MRELRSGSIVDLLFATARAQPEATAICWGQGSTMTYRLLMERVVGLSKRLSGMGVGPGDVVAMVFPDGVDAIVTFLGVAITGTCAPLNSTYKAREFDFYLSDLDAKALLVPRGSSSEALQVAAARRVPVVEIDPIDAADGARAEGTQLQVDRAPALEDVALVLHTSGTTARPKVVPLTHRNLCTSAYTVAETLSLTAADRTLVIMPLFHLHGLVGSVLATLASGGTIIATSGGAHGLLQALVSLRPTWYTAVPTMHQAALAAVGGSGQPRPQTALRFIRSCSAALPPTVMRELEETFGVPVIEAYGMTETSHQIAANPLPPAVRKAGSVGPATGTEVAILDADGNALPRGQQGEVAVRGPTIMGGYRNNPAANNSAYTRGWFRTGDTGYIDEDGYVFLVSRLKEIINRGGEKISPREVEEVLLAHPAVAQSAVFAVPHPTMGENVGAAVVLRADASVTRMQLREFMRDKLAPYKVPTHIVFLPELPRGPTGKVQRVGLADRLADKLSVRRFVAPETEMEAALASIVARVLDLPEAGVETDFFSLGGDSLSALRVVTEAAKQGLALSVDAFNGAPTLRELAKLVTKRASSPSRSTQAVVGAVPLLPLQKMFLGSRPTSPHHFSSAEIVLACDQKVDARWLAEALAHVAQENDAFRLRFSQGPSQEWRQELLEVAGPIPIDEVSLASVSEHDAPAALLAASRGLHTRLSLVDGPVARAAVVRRAPHQGDLVLLGTHHLVSDAYSSSLLADQVIRCYELLAQGKGLDVPAGSVPVSTFARALQQEADAGRFDSDLEYWLARRGTVVGDFPNEFGTSRYPPPSTFSAIRGITCDFAGEQVAQLREAAAQSRGTVAELLLAATVATLNEWTGAQTTSARVFHNGRVGAVDLDVSRTLGSFAYPGAGLFTLQGRDDTAHAVAEVRRQLQAVPHHGVAEFALLGTEKARAVAEVQQKCFRIMPRLVFNYRGHRAPATSGSIIRRVPSVVPREIFYQHMMDPTSATNMTLYFDSELTEDKLITWWSYNSERLKESTARELVARFRRVLDQLVLSV